jgi:hypothetical protein
MSRQRDGSLPRQWVKEKGGPTTGASRRHRSCARVERAPERPVVTIAEVYELADAIQPRYRAMVLLAAFGGFRLGELQALPRARVNPVAQRDRGGRTAARAQGKASHPATEVRRRYPQGRHPGGVEARARATPRRERR